VDVSWIIPFRHISEFLIDETQNYRIKENNWLVKQNFKVKYYVLFFCGCLLRKFENNICVWQVKGHSSDSDFVIRRTFVYTWTLFHRDHYAHAADT